MIANLIEEEIFNSNYIAESDSDFMKRICKHIFDEVSYLRQFVPTEYHAEVISEIEDQVLQVYQTKTYGHLNLQHYRKIHRPKAKDIV